MDAPLTGVVPVEPTIFHDDQTIDLGGTARVVDYLMTPGLTGSACSPTIPSSSH
jgi:dihydrodipicolinate synthase/N-acetylneuraminate lyase